MLNPSELKKIDAYWRASNYLAAGQLYLLDNPLLRRPLALAMALSMILSLGDLGAIAMFGSQELTTLPWLLYQQLGSYRLTEAAATALLLLTLCFSLFWLVERGLGGRHVDH